MRRRIVATVVVAGLAVGALGTGVALAGPGDPAAPARARFLAGERPAPDPERLAKACERLDDLQARSVRIGERLDARLARLQERLAQVTDEDAVARLEQRIARLEEARGKVGTGVARLAERCATAG